VANPPPPPPPPPPPKPSFYHSLGFPDGRTDRNGGEIHYLTPLYMARRVTISVIKITGDFHLYVTMFLGPKAHCSLKKKKALLEVREGTLDPTHCQRDFDGVSPCLDREVHEYRLHTADKITDMEKRNNSLFDNNPDTTGSSFRVREANVVGHRPGMMNRSPSLGSSSRSAVDPTRKWGPTTPIAGRLPVVLSEAETNLATKRTEGDRTKLPKVCSMNACLWTMFWILRFLGLLAATIVVGRRLLQYLAEDQKQQMEDEVSFTRLNHSH